MLLWGRPVWDRDNLHALALAVDQVQEMPDNTLPAALATDQGQLPATHAMYWRAGEQPAGAIYKSGRRAVVAFAGISGMTDARRVYGGWKSPATVPDFPGRVNAFAKVWYDVAKAMVINNLSGLVDDVIFVGHSWGSSIAAMFAAWCQRAATFSRVNLATFGAPRFATGAFHDETPINGKVRVMNYGDIVPYLLPHFTEAPLFHSLHGVQEVMAFNSFVHGGGGMRIRRGQLPEDTNAPAGIAYPLDLNVFAVQQALASSVRAHWPSEYTSILWQMKEDANPSLHHMPGFDPIAPAEHNPELALQEAQNIAAFPHRPWPQGPRRGNVGGNPQVPIIIPPNDPPNGVRGLGITIKKEGQVWYVMHNGNRLYKADSKRDARAWARGARIFATQYQQRPFSIVDEEGVKQALLG